MSFYAGGHFGETLLNLPFEKSRLVANGTTRAPFAVFLAIK